MKGYININEKILIVLGVSDEIYLKQQMPEDRCEEVDSTCTRWMAADVPYCIPESGFSGSMTPIRQMRIVFESKDRI
jgi:hypothetical protein